MSFWRIPPELVCVCTFSEFSHYPVASFLSSLCCCFCWTQFFSISARKREVSCTVKQYLVDSKIGIEEFSLPDLTIVYAKDVNWNYLRLKMDLPSPRSTRKVVDVSSVEHAAAVIRAMRSASHAQVHKQIIYLFHHLYMNSAQLSQSGL